MASYYVATTGNDSTGTGSSGNPYATPGKAAGVATSSGDIIYVKTGTYTLTTSSSNVAGGVVVLSNGVQMEGYATTIGDLGTPPVINTGSVTGVTVVATSGGNFGGIECVITNISVNGVATGNNNNGFACNDYSHRIQRCNAKNCNYGFNISGNSVGPVGCYAESCTRGFNAAGGSNPVTYCVAKSCTFGFYAQRCFGCIAYGGTNPFYTDTFTGSFVNCTAYGGSGDGFRTNTWDMVQYVNCVSYGNGGYGIYSGGGSTIALVNNAYGSNTSGATNITPQRELGKITLTADPFTAKASGDFSLNNTAGGGAACRAAGFPGVFPGGFTTGYADTGAVQHQDSGGTAGMLFVPNLDGV